jgi:hypothetical protein
MPQRRCPKPSRRPSLLQRPLWRQWPHWQLPWPSWPLSRLSRFRWQWPKLLRRFPLRLQRQQQRWLLPRWMALFLQPLWLQLAQLLRQRLLL